MAMLWLLEGDHDAPGWQQLRSDFEHEAIDIIHLDPQVWAVVEADTAPTGYRGLQATQAADGLYLDPNGSPLYVAGGTVVTSAREVIQALGEPAERLLAEIGDPDTVLERLGRAY